MSVSARIARGSARTGVSAGLLVTLVVGMAALDASAESARGAVVQAAGATSSPNDGVPNRIRLTANPRTEGRLRFRVPARSVGAAQATLLVYVTAANGATLDVRASAGRGPARRIATARDLTGKRWIEVDVTRALRGRDLRLTLRSRGSRRIDISDQRGSKTGPRLALRGASGGRPPSAERVSRAQRMGLSMGGDFQYLPEANLNRWLDGAAAAGVQWLRFDLSWFDVQNLGPEEWNWARYDRVISGARARGMKVLPTLGFTPPWARPAGTGNSHPPDDVGAFARFAGEAVRRYAPLGVSHWMVWNEPNIALFWAPGPQPSSYAELLVATAREIRAADPAARVVMGGLAPFGSPGDRSAIRMNPVTFLRGVYRAGGGPAFDAVATHPYSYPARPSTQEAWNAWQQIANTASSVRGVMIANGDADKLVWLSEFGAPTGGPAGERVTRARQAAILVEGYALNQKAPWAGPLFWHTYADSAADPTVQPFFGLVGADLTPKPAYSAYRRIAGAS